MVTVSIKTLTRAENNVFETVPRSRENVASNTSASRYRYLDVDCPSILANTFDTERHRAREVLMNL